MSNDFVFFLLKINCVHKKKKVFVREANQELLSKLGLFEDEVQVACISEADIYYSMIFYILLMFALVQSRHPATLLSLT